jgi:hypothetical protein
MQCTRQDALNSFVLDLMRLPANWTPLLRSQFMQRTLHAQSHFHVISCWKKQGVNDCALRLKTQAQQEQSPQAALHVIQQVQYRGHSTRLVSHWCRFWWQQIPKVFKDQSHWFATYYTRWSVRKPWMYCHIRDESRPKTNRLVQSNITNALVRQLTCLLA